MAAETNRDESRIGWAPGAVSWRDVVSAIRAVGAEASRRGEMFPQTRDEQNEDRAAVRRVAEMVEWYATKGGAVAEQLPTWPKATPPLTRAQAERLAAGLDDRDGGHDGMAAFVWSLAGLPVPAFGDVVTPAPDAQQVQLPALNDALIQILGRPNFACAELAAALRVDGHQIKGKAEHEQAAVLHWMLGIYLKHGANWHDQVGVELARIAAAAEAQVIEAMKRSPLLPGT